MSENDDTTPQASAPAPGSFRLHRGDAVAWLRTLATGSVDLVVTDPAYESLEKHRATGTTTRLKHSDASSNDWFEIFPNARFPEFFVEVYRVLARNAHFYMYCDAETMFVAKPLAESAGFKFWKPLIWDKRQIGMGYHYRARYECILFFEKGKRKLADLGIADILEAPRVRGGYPTEKPVAVSALAVPLTIWTLPPVPRMSPVMRVLSVLWVNAVKPAAALSRAMTAAWVVSPAVKVAV